jgi:hypothetical protein
MTKLPANPQSHARNTWAAALAALAILPFLSGQGVAAEAWQEAGSGAVAILPVPTEAAAITGGSLVCAEQRWSLRLRTGPRETPTSAVPARLSVDAKTYPMLAEQQARTVTLPLSREIVEALKGGSRLTAELGTDDTVAATFALRGSRKVIEAVAPLCSQVDMSAYAKIELSETDAVETARSLLEEEIGLFRAATTATPKVAATRLDRGAGKEMLFATLCGSAWYYGRTGCGLFGFVRTGPVGDWREAYNSEGLAIYTDASTSNGGWPNLVTLDRFDLEPMHWSWNGERYEPRDPLIAADEDPRTGTITP